MRKPSNRFVSGMIYQRSKRVSRCSSTYRCRDVRWIAAREVCGDSASQQTYRASSASKIPEREVIAHGPRRKYLGTWGADRDGTGVFLESSACHLLTCTGTTGKVVRVYRYMVEAYLKYYQSPLAAGSLQPHFHSSSQPSAVSPSTTTSAKRRPAQCDAGISQREFDLL